MLKLLTPGIGANRQNTKEQKQNTAVTSRRDSSISLNDKVSADEARTAKGRPMGAGRRPDQIKHHRRSGGK